MPAAAAVVTVVREPSPAFLDLATTIGYPVETLRIATSSSARDEEVTPCTRASQLKLQ